MRGKMDTKATTTIEDWALRRVQTITNEIIHYIHEGIDVNTAIEKATRHTTLGTKYIQMIFDDLKRMGLS